MNIKIPLPGKLLGAVLLASLISGCVSQPKTLYNWGSYQTQLYAHFKADSSPDKQILEMEKTLQAPESNRPVAPGFHAHLGLLYGEVGRRNDMVEQFKAEKQLFPESTRFMDFLLTNTDPKTALQTPQKGAN